MESEVTKARRCVAAIAVAVAFAPLWWLVGVHLVLFQCVAICAFLYNPAAHARLGVPDVLMLALAAHLSVQAAFFLAGGGDPLRAIAAANNASLLITGVALFQQWRNRQERDPEATLRGDPVIMAAKALFLVVAFASFVSVAFYFATAANADVTITTLVGLAVPFDMPGLLNTSQYARLVRDGWAFSTHVPRLSVMLSYPAAAGLLVSLLGHLAVFATPPEKVWERRVLGGMTFALMALTITRSVLVGGVLGALVALAFLGTLRQRAALCAAALVLAVGVLASPGAPAEIVDRLTSLRGDGTSDRMDVYGRTLTLMLEEAPLTGLGAKPRADDLHVPIGSHSTFLSVALRGGMVGLALAIGAFLLWPAWFWARASLEVGLSEGVSAETKADATVLCRAHAIFTAWLLFGDIDAHALLTVCAFLFLALVSVWGARVRSRTVPSAGAPVVPPLDGERNDHGRHGPNLPGNRPVRLFPGRPGNAVPEPCAGGPVPGKQAFGVWRGQRQAR